MLCAVRHAQHHCNNPATTAQWGAKPILHGAIYHHTSRRRRKVDITPQLRQQVEDTVAAIRAMLASGKLPPPANDARCKECSLNDICQPQAMAEIEKQREMAASLFEAEK
jgi:CRISPR-associated exonuclease Cas4